MHVYKAKVGVEDSIFFLSKENQVNFAVEGSRDGGNGIRKIVDLAQALAAFEISAERFRQRPWGGHFRDFETSTKHGHFRMDDFGLLSWVKLYHLDLTSMQNGCVIVGF